MTIDDDSSIYVGGLPYDIPEDNLRRVFDRYGAVVAVKVVLDRPTRGNCYGFVTFANPRSVVPAIKEMDGKTIDGLVVKVNEVRTRERLNFNHEGSRRNFERGFDGDDNNDRGKDSNYDRHHYRDVQRGRSQGHERESERAHNHARDQYVDEDRYVRHYRPADNVDQIYHRKRERDWERETGMDVEEQRRNSRHRSEDMNEHSNRSPVNGIANRELSLESLSDDQDQGQGQDQIESNFAVSNLKREELQKEISRMVDWTTDKEEEISHLQEKYKNLEDSLKIAKKLTSHRQMQLEKLHKCYLQLKDYEKRTRNADEELQSLVDATCTELEMEGA